MKTLLTVVLIAAVAIAFLPGDLSGQERDLAGNTNKIFIDGSESTVQIQPAKSVQMDYKAVSTGTVTVLDDRYELRMYSLEPLAASMTWVSLGSDIATVSEGIPLYSGGPIIINLSENIPVSWAASEAHKIIILQSSAKE